ncbi:ribosomal biogenesis protein LAS1L [Octopus bimaculoides]|uniref:Ribosomal biogenesis protein LAS1L n=1 Tax=Octopus bimaculoides TaxID=37653 RepID=A0A0L8FY47_OCTBM|nr:ribosomal biogenesis protein LAS1L [Octopus bimaculoides]|eukprot:XP_014786086.1 PREDICTED: ribosomal biogenesis protein LAS1L-like [Octopus bimaculoides]
MASCVSAWFNREEFLEVYNEIFSNDIKKQKHALGRIAVWKSRVPKLPIAIENTAALIRASVEHRQDATSGQTDWESNHKLRNLYGLALIRFINHITETKQNKVYARSLVSIAKELGLPEWLIELRHSATHNKLPSLEIVCTAVDCSLKYLQENFWTKQIQREENQVYHDKPLKDFIRTMLIDYQQCQFELIQSKRRDGKQKLKQLLEGMRMILNETNPEFLSILLEEGYLIPSAEQLEALDISPAELQSQNGLWLPDSLVQFWKPILLLLHTMKFTPVVVKNLMVMVCANNSESLSARLTAGWLMAILFSVNQANQMKDDQNSLYNTPCTLPWKSLVEQALKVPTKYPLHLALWLLTECEGHFQEKQQNHLLELINIYLSQNLTNSSLDIPNDTNGELTNGRGYHTVDDVIQNIQNSTQPESISTPLTSWEISTDINWENYSLGCMPYHKLSFSNLEFYDISDLPAKKRRMFDNYSEHQIAHADHSEVLYVL